MRLQAQQQQKPSTTLNELRSVSASPIPRAFSNLPPNLGVTACCREVFWVTNNAPYCVAGDATIASVNAAAGSASAAECVVEESQRRSFTSTLDGMRKIARHEGISTLWRGLSPTLVMAVPGNVIYFAGYDWLRTSNLSPIKSRVSEVYSPLIAGSTARVLAALFVSPIELFRTRMQATPRTSATSHFRETLDGVKVMVENQGPRTLWRGLTLTLWRDVPFSALYWWGYEATRNSITDMRDRARGLSVDENASYTRNRSNSRSRQNHTTTLMDSFAAGAISGAVASIVTTPFDVGKTRQQVYHHSGDSPGSAIEGQELRSENKSMLRFLASIYKEEGMQGLFRGWAPRMLKVAPACAIMISTYELGKKMAQGVQEKKER